MTSDRQALPHSVGRRQPATEILSGRIRLEGEARGKVQTAQQPHGVIALAGADHHDPIVGPGAQALEQGVQFRLVGAEELGCPQAAGGEHRRIEQAAERAVLHCIPSVHGQMRQDSAGAAFPNPILASLRQRLSLGGYAGKSSQPAHPPSSGAVHSLHAPTSSIASPIRDGPATRA
jgi:hypothetical protein